MELADADLWRLAAENEIESLQDLNVYSLVPRCTVPRGKNVISTKWVFKIKPIKRTRRAWLLKAGTKYRDRTAAAHSLPFVDYRVFEWCLLLLRKWTGRYAAEKGRNPTLPGHYRLGGVSRSDYKVRHHVQLGSTRSCYVKACEGTHGRG